MTALHTTRGHKTLGAKWLFEPRFSHQSLLHLDSEVATNSPNDFIPPNVMVNSNIICTLDSFIKN